jgi:hypothetical protein
MLSLTESDTLANWFKGSYVKYHSAQNEREEIKAELNENDNVV